MVAPVERAKASAHWLDNGFIQRTGVPCTLLAGEEVDLTEPYAIAVFRIVQEALVNAEKHACAKHVEVRITHPGDAVSLRVADAVCGFNAGVPPKANSLGLMGLQERSHWVRGAITIESEAEHGCVIDVCIPPARHCGELGAGGATVPLLTRSARHAPGQRPRWPVWSKSSWCRSYPAND